MQANIPTPHMVTPAADSAAAAGTGYGLVWALPFALMLLSIALLPLTAPRLWHRHQGKIAALCALGFLVPQALGFGLGSAFEALLHTTLHEYLPFLLLLGALYVIGGGIAVRGSLHGSAAQNTALLAVGAALASIMGTTGAAMLMVRPVIRANDARRHNAHVLVFFIFLVANVGGALTPLGDPPLFLGMLKGVGFFWTTAHMLAPTLVLGALLLGVFYLLDRWFWRQEDERRPVDPTPDARLRIDGGVNVALLAGVIGAVLLSGLWQPGVTLRLLGQTLALQDLARDALLLALGALSLRLTPAEVRRHNHFEWAPMLEVARLFLGIFVTIVPVVAMLRAGTAGVLAPLVRLSADASGAPIPAMYYWMCGALSGFLDNAPTYLVFFNLAGGDAQQLMREAAVLTAISSGAVFMGALSYIGNAPNFMVKAIAEQRQVRMPSFFGYLAWSGAILLPCLLLVQLLFFR